MAGQLALTLLWRLVPLAFVALLAWETAPAAAASTDAQGSADFAADDAAREPALDLDPVQLSVVETDAVVKNLATGLYDAFGTKVSGGVHDTDWSWDPPAEVRVRYALTADGETIPPNWHAESASRASRWLHAWGPAREYTYVTRVDLSGYGPASARIEGLRIAADNWVRSLSVNGVAAFELSESEGLETGFFEMREFGTVAEGLFEDGLNTIEVAVVNGEWMGGPENPVGLRLEGVVRADLLDPGLVGSPPSFEGLGDLPGGDFASQVTALSADGLVAVGSSSTEIVAGEPPGPFGFREAFAWASGSGMTGLGCMRDPGAFPWPDACSLATGVSADGGIVIGSYYDGPTGIGPCGNQWGGFEWTEADEMSDLGLGSFIGFLLTGVSADARVVGGERGYRPSVSSCAPVAFPTPYVSVAGQVFEGLSAIPRAYSADGTTVVGDGLLFTEEDGELAGIAGVDVLSADGRIQAGIASGLGFVRTASGAELPLPPLDGDTESAPTVLSAEGGTAFGWSGDSEVREAVRWTGNGEVARVRDLLETQYEFDLTGWTLHDVRGLSNDGRTLTGNGTNPDGDLEAWIARLDAPIVGPGPGAAAGGGAVLLSLAAIARGSRAARRR